ncbi:MAG: hypothetical protein H7332_18310 [Bdellovibrionales bacterium]|nr:hypothetical protein [Ramlibacter sp.]
MIRIPYVWLQRQNMPLPDLYAWFTLLDSIRIKKSQTVVSLPSRPWLFNTLQAEFDRVRDYLEPGALARKMNGL